MHVLERNLPKNTPHLPRGEKMKIQIPKALKKGDKIAIVSLSWGGAGDASFRWRYDRGKKYLQEEFGFEVVEMNHALKGSDYLYKQPKERAQDLMDAFSDPSIKGVFSTIGGDDGVRLLPFIDYEVIKQNPKVFLGYSDTTVHHFMCLKAGVRSYYGPAILSEFGETGGLPAYTKASFQKTLMSKDPIGLVEDSPIWFDGHVPWEEANKEQRRTKTANKGTMSIGANTKASGPLIGGCLDVLEMVKGTSLWPDSKLFEGAILFFESSEETPDPNYIKYWLRNYGAMGILDQIHGLIIGKPFDEKHLDAYKEIILQVVQEEYGRKDLPILYNMNFGHTSPMLTIPYLAMAEIDGASGQLRILEAGTR